MTVEVVTTPRRKRKKKPKQSKASILRQWGLPAHYTTAHLRYTNPLEKGIYWYYFSLYVRRRDVTKYGTCVSCGKPITVEGSQAGHFMPADGSGRDLLFDERNVNAECSPCNAWDETHLLGYAEELDRRYGPGTAAGLRARRQAYKDSKTPIKDWHRDVYAQKTLDLKTKMDSTMQKGKGMVD